LKWFLASIPVLLVVAGCGVPTEPRWDRAVGADDPVTTGPIAGSASLPFEVAEPTVFRIESAPVTAAVTVQARVLPATETIVVAPSDGRIGRLLTATGRDVLAGDPIMSWIRGSSEPTAADELRIEILERQIQLAELEDRLGDAAASAAELDALQSTLVDDEVVLVAPHDGALGQFIASRSETYVAGAEIFTVGDPARLRVDLELGAGEFADIEVGTELRVIDAQDRFAEPTLATVVAVDLVETIGAGNESGIETTAETAETAGSEPRRVSAELADGAPLIVGERVLVDVDQSSGEASRRVSVDAVQQDRGGPFLIIADDEGNWRRVDIEIGVASGEMVEVLADIEVGAVVIVP